MPRVMGCDRKEEETPVTTAPSDAAAAKRDAGGGDHTPDPQGDSGPGEEPVAIIRVAQGRILDL
ncbi:MAG: hypothetical protein IPL59_17465 [Candidatus Competibacteraceae bacterium]|nr:hypothetical protein [Candidatus Competibacteraceae bacterium]